MPGPRLLAVVAVSAAAALTVGCASSTGSADSTVVTAQTQAALTPSGVLADLKAGNERFTSGDSIRRDLTAQRIATAAGQYPKAIILSCLDSRVPPEAVFDQGIGDIFVGRIAGNFENEDMLGSMEFGTLVAGARLIVVLGHTSCGAVKGAIDNAELGNLTATLANIQPAVEMSLRAGEQRTSKNANLLGRVTEANVRRTMSDILAGSEVLSKLVAEGKLMVVGGVYDLESGRVTWITDAS